MIAPLSAAFHADFLIHVKYRSAFKSDYESSYTEDYLRNNSRHDRSLDRIHVWSWREYANISNLCVGTVGYCGSGKSDSACHSDIDSNGRTNFFTRWWNQPELEFGGFTEENRIVELHFLTPKGTKITKEVQLIEVGLGNSGNDDAFEPEMRAFLRVQSPKGAYSTGMFAFKKTANLLNYRIVHTLSEEPDESELAVTFLENGLQNIPFLAGHSTQYLVFGFAFKGGSLFHFASEDVLTLLSVPIDSLAPLISLGLRAKAKNSSDALLCKQAALTIKDFKGLSLVRA
jgi:hypothetical protein